MKRKKKERVQNKDDLFSKLPTDVFFDILSRLSIKTISQCRWVSKTWYDLVRHPLFAELHYARAVQDNSVCAVFRNWCKQFYLIDEECFDNFNSSALAYPPEFRELEKHFTSIETHNCYEVVGSVNGLICFSPEGYGYFDGSPYYICNPITGEYIILPKSPKNDVEPMASGFGVDLVSNEYKVIRILKESNGNKAEVYILGSGKWREISTNLPFITGIGNSNVLVNGCLNWVAYSPQPFFVSFYVGTEEFNIFQLPRRVKNRTRFELYGLTVLADCLCLIVDYDLSCKKEVWVMKSYGAHGSWAKDHDLGREVLGESCYGNHQVTQLKNKKLLSVNGEGNLGYYDPPKKKIKPIKIHNLKKEPVVKIDLPIFQVGSLFSPKHLEITKQ